MGINRNILIAAHIIVLMFLVTPSVSATVTNIEASADTTAYRGSTPETQINTIMGHDVNVGVWNYYNDTTQGKFGYIKFANISGIGSPNIPSNSIINSATMWLYTRAGESQTITFYTPSSPWDENTLNWNNKPSLDTPYASVKQDGSTAHWTTVDVTDIVRKWNDGTVPNNGLVAVSDGGGGSASTDWSSKESPTNKPYISVDYTTQLPIPSPTTPAPIQSASPTTTSSQFSTDDVSFQLHGEKTDVVIGEDILLKLSAVNLITKPEMHVQAIILPPSGMSVTSSEFVESGAGQYTTTYEIPSGKGRDIEVRIRSNQIGEFLVNGRIIYYFGNDKEKVKGQTLNLPIKVKEIVPTSTKTPGFGIILAFVGILFILFLTKNR